MDQDVTKGSWRDDNEFNERGTSPVKTTRNVKC